LANNGENKKDKRKILPIKIWFKGIFDNFQN